MNVWPPDGVLSGFYNQTIREILRVSIGGSRVRLRLTNEFGTAPLIVDAVQLAMAGEGGAIEPFTSLPVTFGGDRSATICAGSPLLSDPVDLAVAPLARLAVSIFVGGYMPIHTHHYEAQQTTYISIPGNFAAAERMPGDQTTTSRYFISAVFCEAEMDARAVACFGDSLTDGYCSRIDGDARWPDVLAERLQRTPGFENVAVLNQGIGGNRVLHSRRGDKALERFDRDVLSFAGVSHLVLLEGANDIIWPNTVLAGPEETVSAERIIAGYRQLIERAQLAGIKVIMGTLTPFEFTLPDQPFGGYYTADKERMRRAVNRWIREECVGDAVVDFDAALRDPKHPARLLPDFDSGDHIHPNDAGYRAMAHALDPALLS
jgi:lysophospholipase L1-like esterase